ncbi:hypothetical protein [Tsukamurella spumae]|uniref:Uncharacterized protein n=1 Tax=Tsukamurella spumae TaxID=44753 RepID=A0A846X5Z8_9ACTN|nr:hypothetical protein [Tsukamurella spumae]NKY19739.1 hypothetical protein [Tsukamurella spumae]
MSLPHRSRRHARERHLYLVPPLDGADSTPEAPAPSKPKAAPTGFPWDIPTTPSPWGMPSKPKAAPYAGRPAYVHTIPQTMPADDHHEHPARPRVQWQRLTDQEDN